MIQANQLTQDLNNRLNPRTGRTNQEIMEDIAEEQTLEKQNIFIDKDHSLSTSFIGGKQTLQSKIKM